MKHEVSKRRQPLLRTVVYSLMTLTVTVIVSLLMLVVMGYSFDQKAGRLEQGGLLQFGSVPQGATVTLNEVRLGPRTNTKATVDAGNHSVSFDRKGYRSWKKSISVKPAQIGWLNYARLIPQTITHESLRTFTTLSGALASPQHNYMLLHEAPDKPQFVLVNIQSDTVRYEDIALPELIYTEPTAQKRHRFSIESWSNDEQAIIIRHTFDENKEEWLLLNRSTPSQSVNLNKAFAIEPSRIQFAGKGNRLLFVQTGDSVRRINLDSPASTQLLANRVDNFSAYDDKMIFFATLPDESNQRSVGYASTDNTFPRIISVFPNDGQQLYIASKMYFNKYYVSVLHGKELSVNVGSTLPNKENKSTLKQFVKLTVSEGVFSLTMTDNGRFVVVQFADGYGIYDIELQKYDKTMWAIQSSAQQKLNWLDPYMIWSDNGGMLRFYEFDGANQQNIMNVAEGYSASISPNDKYVYAIGRTPDNRLDLRRALLQLP